MSNHELGGTDLWGFAFLPKMISTNLIAQIVFPLLAELAPIDLAGGGEGLRWVDWSE